MIRKPTPNEIAQLLNEDEYGQTLLPVAVSPIIGVRQSVAYDQQQTRTEMRACAAGGCSNNHDGACSLEAISVNERGGCNEYEAMADAGDDGRYEEEPTADVTGGLANQMTQPLNVDMHADDALTR